MQEIEILARCSRPKEELLAALAQFQNKGIKRVVDVYYFHPADGRLQPDKNGRLTACLRLREKDEKVLLTYKNDHFDGDVWKYSDEHETVIADINVMRKILEHLGFKELVVIDNTRHFFETDTFEIVLEDVVGLGEFIEVEWISTIADPMAVKEKIRSFIKTLDPGAEELNAGKPELMLRKRLSSEKSQ
jgi:adenylate cyclase class 2